MEKWDLLDKNRQPKIFITFLYVSLALLFAACAPSVNTESPASNQQASSRSADNNSTAASSHSSSSASVENQAPADTIDTKIVNNINSGSLDIGDLKIGDPVDKVFTELDYSPAGYEMMYQNYFCMQVSDGYLLYYNDSENKKKIAGYIYIGTQNFKITNWGNSTISDVEQIFGKPSSVIEGKWTELFDEDNEDSEYKKELHYEVGSYELYFDFSDNEIWRIVYKTKAPLPNNLPAIAERFQTSSLKELLKESQPIRIFKSPSGNDIVYTVQNSDYSDNVYLWREEDEKPVQIQAVSDADKFVYFAGTSVVWSPDDKYFILSSGTDILRNNYIISAADCKINASLRNYNSLPLWTQDSRKIIFNQPSEITLKANIGDGQSSDIAIYDLDTNKTDILEKGTADYWFFTGSIKDNVLTYTRSYPETGKEEIVTVNLK